MSSKNKLCPVFGKCGGCDTLNAPYVHQLQAKQTEIEELFSKKNIGANSSYPIEMRPIIGMSEPFHYRNKITSPFVYDKRSKQIISGMYAKGSHRIIPNDECILENEIGQKVIFAIKRIMKRHRIAPYNEDAGTGFLRHAVIRIGHKSGEVLVTLVTNTDEFPHSKSFCKELMRDVPEITTIVQNVNQTRTNAILGSKERTLFGPGFILDKLCGLSFRISSHSFYQTNCEQTEILYRQAIKFAGSKNAEEFADTTIVDAYCGTGTLGIVAASFGAKKVIGFDNIASAISDAKQNAKHNGIENAQFVCCSEDAFVERLNEHELKNLVIIMDPPRSGSTEKFLTQITSLKPAKIVYVSCNPKTQVRDVITLQKLGYYPRIIQSVDMFPHTYHIENICLLTPDDPNT